MYVCVCNAITEEQIRRAIADGASNLDDLCEALGLGDQCGKCLEYVCHYFCEEASQAPDESRRTDPAAQVAPDNSGP